MAFVLCFKEEGALYPINIMNTVRNVWNDCHCGK